MKVPNKFFRIGIILHGSKIWFSELVSIVIVGLLLISLLTISLIIFTNEIAAHHNNRIIARLKTENVVLRNDLDQIKQTEQIAQTLCSFLDGRIPAPTIYKLSKLVYSNSTQFGYDPILLLAVIHVESFFNTDALGKFRSGALSGALGLMQLKFETAQQVAQKLQLGQLSRVDLLKPEVNIIIGVAYLTQLITQFKSFKLGLLAYNLGPATVLANMNKKEELSAQYYKKVLRSYYKLKKFSNRSSQAAPHINFCE